MSNASLPPPCVLQLGEVSAAAAAGLYFEERRALLSSLWLLLQAQVRGWRGVVRRARRALSSGLGLGLKI